MKRARITYKRAGVNIDEGNRLVEKIARWVKRTPQKGVVSGIGGFSALYDVGKRMPSKTLIAATTDGVGTKLALAKLQNNHRTIGIDLVAMSVNDLITVGAEPLFFLDYFATGRLQAGQAGQVLKGIVEGCRQADCTLIGGETAEMPGIYKNGDYDLAGFAVCAVRPDRLPARAKIRPGDAVLGLASSGVHSNGYSLIRRIFSRR